MKKNVESKIWGVVIILVGIIYLGNIFTWWDVKIFFKGWWTLFIIIPSIIGLFKKEWVSSLLGLSIGALLLFASNSLIEWNLVGKLFISIVLIVVGISILFKPKFKNVNKNDKGLPEFIGLFSGNEPKITDEFKGASIKSIFGGVDLDLSNAIIKEDIQIDCISIFGGTDIRLPKNVNAKYSGVPVFGGIEDKSEHSKKGPIVLINYVCVFGGIDLK